MWVLGGLVVLVVIVLTVAATLFVTGRQSDEAGPGPTKPTPTTAVDTSEIASADDDGPVEIITEDPTCAGWTSISNRLAEQASRGWDARDESLPISDWSPEQREGHQVMVEEMRKAADQSIALARQTPHRVVRELYEQSIAYWRSYASKTGTYTPVDDHLARVATATSNALTWICSAIDSGSASARAAFVVPSPAPKRLPQPTDPNDAPRFLLEPLPVCSEWAEAVDSFGTATAAWFSTDPNIPATQWTPDRQAIYADMSLVMQKNADELQRLGMKSKNVVFDDFAALAAQYRRAYVQSFSTYVPADTYLSNAATELSAAINQACLYAGDT